MHSWPSDWPIIHTFDPNHAKTWGQSRARPPLYKTNNLTGNMSSVPLSSPGGQFPLKIQFIVLLEIIGSVIPCEVRSKPLRIFLDSFCSNWKQIIKYISQQSKYKLAILKVLNMSNICHQKWKFRICDKSKVRTRKIQSWSTGPTRSSVHVRTCRCPRMHSPMPSFILGLAGQRAMQNTRDTQSGGKYARYTE